MGKNKQTAQLITTAEALSLSEYAKVSTIQFVKQIWDEWEEKKPYRENIGFHFCCMLATIYEAGRIQGKREERRRRRRRGED